jgi:hypothetical protein
MFKLRTSTPVVEFCERCGSVCDRACRANQAREQARLAVLRHGARFA